MTLCTNRDFLDHAAGRMWRPPASGPQGLPPARRQRRLLAGSGQPMLQRIYGTAPLRRNRAHLARLEKRKARPSSSASSIFSPSGGGPASPSVRAAWSWQRIVGYCRTLSAAAATRRSARRRAFETLWHRAGIGTTKDNMYFTDREQNYAVKPMNCPGSLLVYRARALYRELPLRLSEWGTVHRFREIRRLARFVPRAGLHARRRAHLLHA